MPSVGEVCYGYFLGLHNAEQVKFIDDKMSGNVKLTIAKLKNKLAEE